MTRNDNRISPPIPRDDHMSPTLAETSFRRSRTEMPPPPASVVLAIGAVLSLLLVASVPAGAGMKPILHLSLPVEAETRAGAGAEAHSILSVCVLTTEAAQVAPTCAAQPASAPGLDVPGLEAVPDTE
jgi:hypothetical protein